MLAQRLARASALRAAPRRLPIIQARTFLPESLNSRTVLDEKFPDTKPLTEAEDPGQNGGYLNPPNVKRQFRDPHADWWDKQERRNYGEPVHEDHDILGMFSPHEYTWVSPRKGLFQIGAFIAVFTGVCMVVAQLYPDRPSFPREFEGGLERELGGAGAVRARSPEDPEPFQPEESDA
ncbi:NADH:ubiquinone oxidoreductase 20.1kD subunit [Microdochium trichocladiopsis]|uniref:NADH:ubiquinone oxidoreductase 20.1kD subunit n=1 Tax=Microdochium trichocladiopsis TaxID=1682393 RepID=A0A9P8Y184_9PEZI|nr:NADH:ubiquinone oxidoreductase 20.1kD subunit [Microdochium trichocladiopsis]KAH7027256.1 NADH:ubiquinone oxidoreductase 20.1kD subunit [Microdochium trichocladiopsis]